MRKSCILALIALLLMGSAASAEGIDLDGIRHGDYADFFEEHDAGVVEAIAIPNSVTATAVASSIASNIIENIDDMYTIVCFDDTTSAWIVSFTVDELTVGGDFSVALRASDGCVVKMWFGE